jgi:GNAT superfamily N-acetyltransferase
MAEQVPLLLISRLAVDASCHGRGIGTALLTDALRRCLAASDIIGARGAVAHANDDDALRFYRRRGFLSSPLGEHALVMPIETMRALLAA